MSMRIGEVAERMGISTSAIRFYDRKGLLPFVDRDEHGRRQFKENDFNYIETIDCLKRSGVPIKTIATFIELCMQGDASLRQRYDYLDEEEQHLQAKIEELQAQQAFLHFKKWYYKTAIEAGTESLHFIPGTTLFQPDLQEQFERLLATGQSIDALTRLDEHRG